MSRHIDYLFKQLESRYKNLIVIEDKDNDDNTSGYFGHFYIILYCKLNTNIEELRDKSNKLKSKNVGVQFYKTAEFYRLFRRIEIDIYIHSNIITDVENISILKYMEDLNNMYNNKKFKLEFELNIGGKN